MEVQLVFDKIDRNDETLSGGGTTHRVNGIIIQKAVIGPQLPPKDLPSIAKEHQRSISLDIPVLPTYIDGKRPEPPILPRIECSSLVKKETADRKTLIWLLSRKINSGNQVIPDRIQYQSADYQSSCMRLLREMADPRNQDRCQHPDLTAARIGKDERAVATLGAMLQTVWTNPFEMEKRDLCGILTGTVPQEDVVLGLLSAKEVGEKLWKKTVSERLLEEQR